jgi:hypothetical protein
MGRIKKATEIVPWPLRFSDCLLLKANRIPLQPWHIMPSLFKGSFDDQLREKHEYEYTPDRNLMSRLF